MPVKKIKRTPINLRQSGDSEAKMLINTRVRKSPYWHLSERHGCRAYTVMNNMYHPRAYVAPEDGGLLKEHEWLTHGVTLWNVAVERQICFKGPDAVDFVNLLVTRDIKAKAPVGQARYVVLCNPYGGIINDPILLRVAEDEVWLSISASDVLLWATGVNYGLGYDVDISELDVAPVQIQGPKSKPLMEKMVRDGVIGEAVLDLAYYELCWTTFDGMDVVVSRTGFSGEVGYEIYLTDATDNADALWSKLLDAGEAFDIHVIAPSHIRRLEAGILSYNQDIGMNTNPFEVGLDWQLDFDKPDFIGKDALLEIRERGVDRRLVGLRLGGEPITWYNPDFWIVRDADGDAEVGYVTTAFFSPNVGSNIALAMLPTAHAALGTPLTVALPDEPEPVAAEVVEVPFHDPEKRIPKSA